MGWPTYAATYPEDTLRLQEALKEVGIEIPLGKLADMYHAWCEDYWCAGWLILDEPTIDAFCSWIKDQEQNVGKSESPLFSVQHQDGHTWTLDELTWWVSQKDETNLVWTDVTGFLINAWGELHICDSCGNAESVDDETDMILVWGQTPA